MSEAQLDAASILFSVEELVEFKVLDPKLDCLVSRLLPSFGRASKGLRCGVELSRPRLGDKLNATDPCAFAASASQPDGSAWGRMWGSGTICLGRWVSEVRNSE